MNSDKATIKVEVNWDELNLETKLLLTMFISGSINLGQRAQLKFEDIEGIWSGIESYLELESEDKLRRDFPMNFLLDSYSNIVRHYSSNSPISMLE